MLFVSAFPALSYWSREPGEIETTQVCYHCGSILCTRGLNLSSETIKRNADQQEPDETDVQKLKKKILSKTTHFPILYTLIMQLFHGCHSICFYVCESKEH